MNINIYVYIYANQLEKKGFQGEMWHFKISPPWDSNEGYISKCVLRICEKTHNILSFYVVYTTTLLLDPHFVPD